jgi:hypothetical protein
MNRVLLGLAALMALLSGACYSLIAEVDIASCDRDVGTCTVTLAKVHRMPGPPPDDNTAT